MASALTPEDDDVTAASEKRTEEFFSQTRSDIMGVISDEVTEGRQVLLDAGVDANILKDLPQGTLALVARAPNLAQAFAKRYPSESYSDYTAIESAVFSGVDSGVDAYSSAYDENTITRGGMEFKKLRNGVIIQIDLSTGDEKVLMPNDPEGVIAGSTNWVRKAEKRWDEKTVSKWREKLYARGYVAEEDGPLDGPMKQALRAYHQDRYLGNLPGKISEQRVKPKEAYDPVARRQAVRVAFNAIAQDDPTDEEMQPFLRAIDEEVRRALKHGATPEHAQAKAEERLAEEITEDPQLKWIQAENAENTDFTDSITAFAQAWSAFG